MFSSSLEVVSSGPQPGQSGARNSGTTTRLHGGTPAVRASSALWKGSVSGITSKPALMLPLPPLPMKQSRTSVMSLLSTRMIPTISLRWTQTRSLSLAGNLERLEVVPTPTLRCSLSIVRSSKDGKFLTSLGQHILQFHVFFCGAFFLLLRSFNSFRDIFFPWISRICC